jgi:glycosyltransferase involved in cell wall biosynthesis
MNIFIGAVNPLLIYYAKTNILLFDESVFPRASLYTLRDIDYVFTKTDEITRLLQDSVSKDKLVNIGWRSTDLNSNFKHRDYNKCLLFCHDNKQTSLYQKIIKAWNDDDRLNSDSGLTLHVVNFQITKMKESDITNSSIVIEKGISQEKFEIIFNSYGTHICLDEHYNFSHYLNQSMLCKSLLILPNSTVRNVADGDYAFYVEGKKSRHKSLFGSRFVFDGTSFVSRVLEVGRLSNELRENLGAKARNDALKYHSKNDFVFRETFTKIVKESVGKPKPINHITRKPIKDSELPTVSVVTLTHNRKKFFRLAIFNFNQIDYPKDKLEWVIYDTSNKENRVEDLLPGEDKRSKYNIKYFKSDCVETIGESRNFALKNCSNDIVVFFDDDDYYPSESVKRRVTPLVDDDNISMVACSALGTFEINKYISFVDYPTLFESGSRRMRIGTLALRRNIIGKNENYWCDKTSINEFHTIISSNLRNIREISWEGVIVSLVHTKNTTWRKIPQGNEQTKNTCEFGFGEKMFKFLTELDKSDEELIEQEELKKRKIEEALKEAQSRQNPTTEGGDGGEGNNPPN